MLGIGIGALVALGLTACGGSSSRSAAGSRSSAATARVVRTAYETTLSQKTVTFTFTETMRARSTTGSTQAQTLTGSGEADLASHDFEVDINAPSGGTVKVLGIGATEYTSVPPAQQSQVPGHKPWVEINLNQVDEAKLGRSFAQLASANNDNPTHLLSNLSQVSNSVTKVGTATVRGVTTTEYRAEVNLNKVAARDKVKEGAKAAQAVQQEEQALGKHTLAVEVWIDPQKRVRQLEVQIPIPAASAGATNGSGSAIVRMDFTAYGRPVTITAPPHGQVANITSLAVAQAKASSR